VELSQVTVTCGSEDEAGRIAGLLLDAHLAACVQVVGPVTSRYWWEGAVETATEWLCLAKTRAALVDDIVTAVRGAHSYDVPEIVATPITGGSADYLAWVASSTGGGAEG
jgi:periplasmic divalent cation tolerance protein